MKAIILSILVLLIISGVSYGEEPDGFLGFKWRSSIEEFCKLENPSPYPIVFYGKDCKEKFTVSDSTKEGERYGYRLVDRIGDVATDKVLYFFKQDRFYKTATLFRDNRNYLILKGALNEKYGSAMIKPLVLKINPNARSGEECIWTLRSVSIILTFNEIKDEGQMVYTYMPIETEKILEDRKSIKKTKDAL
jgi:hypothetical protein